MLKWAEEAVLELAKAARAIRLYPPTHPARGAVLQQCAARLGKVLQQGDLALTVSPKGFQIDADTVAPHTTSLLDLAEGLHQRGVQALVLRPGLRPDELAAFLDLFEMEAEQVAAQGGPVALLQSRGVTCLQVGEVDYAWVTSARGEAPIPGQPRAAGPGGEASGEAAEWRSRLLTEGTRGLADTSAAGHLGASAVSAAFRSGEDVRPAQADLEPQMVVLLPQGAEAGLPDGATPRSAKAVGSLPTPGELTGTPPAIARLLRPSARKALQDWHLEQSARRLEKLLAEMQVEVDDARYAALSDQVQSIAQGLLSLGLVREVLPSVGLFALHARSYSVPEGRRAQALSCLKALAHQAVIGHLVDLYFEGPHEETEVATELLRAFGEVCLQAVLNRLLTAQRDRPVGDLARLITRILPMERAALGPLAERAGSEKTELAQAAVALIGELRLPEGLAPLAQALVHPDPEVRVEAARAVAKVPGQHAARLLVGMAEGADPVVAAEAIAALGARRERAALPVLLRAARGSALGLGRVRLRQEALRALGCIGGSQAIDLLVRTLRRPALFAWRAGRALRVAAAEGLAAAGGEQAQQALRRGVRAGCPDVRAACERALRRVRGGPRLGEVVQ